MGEYARVYGEDGFKIADGTHKITKYDVTIVFWMVIDCLLKSKFVGYTANFTKIMSLLMELMFFPAHPVHFWMMTVIMVGGIPGDFDPFVDNEIDLDADAIPASKVLSDNTVPHSLSC